MKHLNDLEVAKEVDLSNPIHQKNLAFLENIFANVNAVVESHFPSTDYTNMDTFLVGYHGDTRTLKRREFIKVVKELKYYEVGQFDGKFLVKTGLSKIEEAGPYIQKLEKLAIAFSEKHAKITSDELAKISAWQHFKIGLKKLFRRKA